MIVHAVGLRPQDSIEPSSDILLRGDRFEVIRIDAVPDAAQMVELESFGDRANHPLVGHTVSGSNIVRPDSEQAVALPSDAPIPQPALRCFLDLDPEPKLR